MAKSMLRILAGIALSLACFLLAACDNGGTELPNELRGSVTQGGRPAANVKVGLYGINYIPWDSANGNQAWTTETDAHGDYVFPQVPPGRYNVVGVLDSLGFFRDSVSVSGATDLGRDSLRSLGNLSGVVQLQPQDEPRNAFVQVMGTDIYVNVDETGGFNITGLAAGVYRLRVFVAVPGYVALFKLVEIHPGRHEILPEPLVPFYSGVPVVTGVRVSLDTATGIAKITWHPVSYHPLLTYLVYRDALNSANLSVTPLNALRLLDTVYYDTLYRTPESYWNGATVDSTYRDTLPHDWEYRVRVKANNSAIGDAYEAAVLHAISPMNLLTRISISRLDRDQDLRTVFRGDTIRLAARFANISIANRKLVWMDGNADTLRKIDINAKSGWDSLTWIAPKTLGYDSIFVKVTDVNGKVWSGSAQLGIVAAHSVGETKLRATHVEAHAWNGKVVHVARDDTTGRMSIGIFDPETRQDSLLAPVVRISDSGSFAFSDSKVIFLGAIHPDFPGANVIEFDLATGAWAKEPSLPESTGVLSAVGAAGKVYILTASAKSQDSLDVYSLDLATHAWSAKKPHASNFVMGLSEAGGTVYLSSSMNGPYATSWEKYDPLADAWTAFPSSEMMQQSLFTRLVEMDGTLYSVGGLTTDSIGSNQIERFDAAQNAWMPAPSFLLGRVQPGVAAIGSSIYILGGSAWYGVTADIEEYRPE